MWSTLLERIVALEKEVKKKNHNVQELANELFNEQENQAYTIGTLYEHVRELDSVAIGVSG